MSIDRSKIIILVTGSMNSPWDSNWKECVSTWVPLVRKLGYNVKIAIGDPSITDLYLDEGEIIRFKTSDSKSGLVDKSVTLPIRWILENTVYDYYFRIDSDSFVHPIRFDSLIQRNLIEFSPDYMGMCIPYPGLDPNTPITKWIEKDSSIPFGPGIPFASGTAYLVSRKVMPNILKSIKIESDWELECDEYVLGRAMHENDINLLHDSSIHMESKWNIAMANPYGVKIPEIGEKDSHLAIQHYQNGHMVDIMLELIK